MRKLIIASLGLIALTLVSTLSGCRGAYREEPRDPSSEGVKKESEKQSSPKPLTADASPIPIPVPAPSPTPEFFALKKVPFAVLPPGPGSHVPQDVDLYATNDSAITVKEDEVRVGNVIKTPSLQGQQDRFIVWPERLGKFRIMDAYYTTPEKEGKRFNVSLHDGRWFIPLSEVLGTDIAGNNPDQRHEISIQIVLEDRTDLRFKLCFRIQGALPDLQKSHEDGIFPASSVDVIPAVMNGFVFSSDHFKNRSQRPIRLWFRVRKQTELLFRSGFQCRADSVTGFEYMSAPMDFSVRYQRSGGVADVWGESWNSVVLEVGDSIAVEKAVRIPSTTKRCKPSFLCGNGFTIGLMKFTGHQMQGSVELEWAETSVDTGADALQALIEKPDPFRILHGTEVRSMNQSDGSPLPQGDLDPCSGIFE